MEGALDAATLRDAMRRYLDLLREHREELDSLNVFPVPDGDTGTNLVMTQQAVADAVVDASEGTLGDVVETMSRAALLGARGNSGVILSQVLRGLGESLRAPGAAGVPALVEAFRRAADEARRAVAEPMEGTMLTVLRDGATAAQEAAVSGGDVATVADAALDGAKRSLERTPELLPDLARAGVVDAGAKGAVLLFDALAGALSGGGSRVEVGPLGPVGRGLETAGARAETSYGHEVMYLLECEDDHLGFVREELGGLGDSLVVVGGGGLYTVHVHTDSPEAAVDVGERAGATREVRVTSLDQQVAERCLAGEARGVRVDASAGRKACALVAVAPGHGVARLFRSLGADVVEGGPGALPSVEELVRAIERAPSDSVLVLANHRNVRPAAEQAAGHTARHVEIVPTRSIPEGIAAATAFNPDAPPQRNVAEIEDVRSRVAAAEVALAVRDAETPAGNVRAGDALGVVDGTVTAVGDSPLDVALEVARSLASDEQEVATILVGADVDEEEAARARDAFAAAFPDLEIELHRGDQPLYPYLIGLE